MFITLSAYLCLQHIDHDTKHCEVCLRQLGFFCCICISSRSCLVSGSCCTPTIDSDWSSTSQPRNMWWVGVNTERCCWVQVARMEIDSWAGTQEARTCFQWRRWILVSDTMSVRVHLSSSRFINHILTVSELPSLVVIPLLFRYY